MSEATCETSVERKERKRKLEEELAAINAIEVEENEKAKRAALIEQIPEKYRPFFKDAWATDYTNLQKAQNELQRTLEVVQQIWVTRRDKFVFKRSKTGGSALRLL